MAIFQLSIFGVKTLLKHPTSVPRPAGCEASKKKPKRLIKVQPGPGTGEKSSDPKTGELPCVLRAIQGKFYLRAFESLGNGWRDRFISSTGNQVISLGDDGSRLLLLTRFSNFLILVCQPRSYDCCLGKSSGEENASADEKVWVSDLLGWALPWLKDFFRLVIKVEIFGDDSGGNSIVTISQTTLIFTQNGIVTRSFIPSQAAVSPGWSRTIDRSPGSLQRSIDTILTLRHQRWQLVTSVSRALCSYPNIKRLA